MKADQDSLQMKKDPSKKRKRFVTVSSEEQDPGVAVAKEPSFTRIDINNYVFDKQAFVKLSVRDTNTITACRCNQNPKRRNLKFPSN